MDTLQLKHIMRIRARRRFKAVVRLVILNKSWLVEDGEEELGGNVKKNVIMLTRRKKQKSLLSLNDKRMLNTPTQHRTEQEKLHLGKILGGLKCFRRYPPLVRNQLASVCFFVYYGPGRIVVKQDQEADALYFILSGEVLVSKIVFDPILNENVDVPLGTMEPGSMFGEVSLLHDILRTATITTAEPCEMLMLKRYDFDSILKKTVQAEWDAVKAAMSKFEYFDGWDEVAIRECCILSTMVTFVKDDIIFDEHRMRTPFVYFILSGECCLIEDLFILREFDYKGDEIYKLFHAPFVYKKIDNPLTNPSVFGLNKDTARNLIFLPRKVKCHFIQVCVFSKTACFGLGENMTNRRIIAMKDVLCLRIPRYWLQIHNPGNIWAKIIHFMNNHIPSTNQVFKKFCHEKKWERFKNDLVNKITNKAPTINVNQIPYSIRINHVD